MLEFDPRDYFHHVCSAGIFVDSFHRDGGNSHLHDLF